MNKNKYAVFAVHDKYHFKRYQVYDLEEKKYLGPLFYGHGEAWAWLADRLKKEGGR